MEIDESTDAPASVHRVTVEKTPFKYTHITSTIDNTKDSSTILYDTTRMNTAVERTVTSSEFSTAKKSAAFKLTTLPATTTNPTKLMTSSYESEETSPTTALQTNGKPTVSIGQLLSSSTVSLTNDSNATTERPSQTMTVTSEAVTNNEASPLVLGTDRTEWLTELQTQLYSSLNMNDGILTDVDDGAKSSTTSESTKPAYQHHSTEMSFLTSTLTSHSTDIPTASTSNIDLFRSGPISSVEASTPLEIVSTEEYTETVRKSTTMATNSVPADDSSTSITTVPETLGTDKQITTAASREGIL